MLNYGFHKRNYIKKHAGNIELGGIVTEGRKEFNLFSQTLAFLLILADYDKGFHGVGTHWSHKLILHHQHVELKAIRQQ